MRLIVSGTRATKESSSWLTAVVAYPTLSIGFSVSLLPPVYSVGSTPSVRTANSALRNDIGRLCS